MRRSIWIGGAAGVLGFALGVLAAWSLAPRVDGGGEVAARSTAPPRDADVAAARGAEARRTAAPTAADPPTPDGASGAGVHRAAEDTAPIFDEKLRVYGESELRAGWASVRPDEMPAAELARGTARYEEIVVHSPRAIGRELAEKATRLEQATRRARGLGILEQVRQGLVTAKEVTDDPKRFDSIFAPETTGPEVVGDRALADPDAKIADGTTLAFGPGIFELDLRRALQSSDPPRDVTVTGAGMDQTLLLVQDATLAQPLVGFTLRDASAYSSRGDLLDLRRDGILTLERVRIVGFDIGAGSSTPLYLFADAAVRADDCRFEGGYGPHPEHGSFIRWDGEIRIGRFERCRFYRVDMSYLRGGVSTSLVFEGCRFEQLPPRPDAEADLAHQPGVALQDCKFTYADPDHPPEPPTELDRLFPGWRERAAH